ncbi:hypothetical protein A2483_04140 [Candidatus Peregrinibacteria bacterium RIFOXYC2_FULL_33_13]|nr:MAG: Phosphoribosyltransferase [Candidatus Peregrinibacteria bacterium GW2011_GWA2_33_10]KKP41247.1 MAG: phosphoribosyltransferase [Candidatus Peregrinibacteria bacterium GW2011_GWC2_33_13]OGJ50335.1 MAG: hypothetical protein A2229_02540 [Candidatus Peregrinibacteria bacterium RIFOXYA2_FULL_33_7]OGJ55394.1 MAG: hypothetical protein A2483_04140 [Candidatus Peregrinibacteria bacterium RIFOXYC2_FULL_33_13]
MIKYFLNFIFPERCIFCRKLGGYICSECDKNFIEVKPQICYFCEEVSVFGKICPRCKNFFSFDNLFICYRYKFFLKKLLLNFKYNFRSILAKKCALLIYKRIKEINFKNCLICYVPSDKKRFRWRGFCHTQLIARYLSDYLDLECKDILEKKVNSDFQSRLDRGARMSNIKGKFSVRFNCNIVNKNIILIDDVVSTGSTLNECAKALRNAGARRVFAVVMGSNKG